MVRGAGSGESTTEPVDLGRHHRKAQPAVSHVLTRIVVGVQGARLTLMVLAAPALAGYLIRRTERRRTRTRP